MKQLFVLERKVPGHFILADRCKYFQHTDISMSEHEEDTIFCISSIGAMPPQSSHDRYFLPVLVDGQLYEKINATNIYETLVFDKELGNPWREIEGFRSNDLSEIKKKHQEFVNYYKQVANKRIQKKEY